MATMEKLDLQASVKKGGDIERKSRNFTIDAFRLIGAFSVVFLHTLPPNDVPTIFAALHGATRWAVPFFFLVSGYYFKGAFDTSPKKALVGRLKNLASIYTISSIIYIILKLLTGSPPASVVSVGLLIIGSYFHLWFIASMIIGYVVVWVLLRQDFGKRTLISIIAFTLVIILCTGSYSKMVGLGNLPIQYSRHLLSVPFLLLGYLCAKYRPFSNFTVSTAVITVGLGIILQQLEAYFLYYKFSLSPVNNDFLVGTLIFSCGMLVLAMAVNTQKDNLISKLGRDHSLLVYLYHPLLMKLPFLDVLNGYFFSWWMQASTVFALCLLLFFSLDKTLPSVYRFLSGSLWK